MILRFSFDLLYCSWEDFMYVWHVFKNNKTFMGHIVSSSQTEAVWEAKKQYGDFVWIERASGENDVLKLTRITPNNCLAQ